MRNTTANTLYKHLIKVDDTGRKIHIREGKLIVAKQSITKCKHWCKFLKLNRIDKKVRG